MVAFHGMLVVTAELIVYWFEYVRHIKHILLLELICITLAYYFHLDIMPLFQQLRKHWCTNVLIFGDMNTNYYLYNWRHNLNLIEVDKQVFRKQQHACTYLNNIWWNMSKYKMRKYKYECALRLRVNYILRFDVRLFTYYFRPSFF